MMKTLEIPFITFKIPAGFPSPAQDWIDQRIDLNEMLINSPSSTFLFRATGESMRDAGIFENSLLLVDRSISAKPNHIVVAAHEGDFTVKRLITYQGKMVLSPANPSFPIIPVTETTEIWGVVIATITECMR